MSPTRPAAVVVLAAGEGTRMRSDTPKVLHRIGGRSLLGHAMAAARALDPEHLVVVVRHERERVAAHIREVDPGAVVADQDELKGTARAVACGLAPLGPLTGTVVVTYGDVPLLDDATLRDLVAAHDASGSAVTVLTARVADPTGYGRVLRDAAGDVVAIVEHKDADDAQRAVDEINSGIYAFDAAVLADALGRIRADNAQGELYLTDVLAVARADGHRVAAVTTGDVWQVEGVNDRVQLAALGGELNRRVLTDWMRAGVTVVDPASTWVDVTVELAPDVTLLPGTQLHGATRVAGGATIGPDTTLTDCEIGPGAGVIRTHGSGATIGAGASVGPFSYLRPGTVLGERGKIGAYVEAKNAVIGTGSKVPHLTYVGDAEIGEHSNIGAATVFVNYDGVQKHRTVVGDHVRVGSDTMLVAPVTIGDGAYTAAGSVVVGRRAARGDGGGTVAAAQRGGMGGAAPRRHRLGRGGGAGPGGRPRGRSGPVGRDADMTGITSTSEKRLVVASGRAHPDLAHEVVGVLGVDLVPMDAYDFANGEIYVRFGESVRGCDAFVIQSHTAPINEWLMEQLIMVDALKRASAKRITVIAPFYPYARQDKKHRGREPISARLVSDLYKTAGADRLMAVDLHTAQIQGFFDGPVDHLWALPLLADHVRKRVDRARLTVVSPDAGRVRVADLWSDRLGAPLAIIHKRRDPSVPNQVKVHEVVGQVAGRTCLIVDDMIDTGGTIVQAAEALRENGAAEVIVAATHAVLSGPAVDRLKNSAITEVIVTNTLPIDPERTFPQLTVLSIAPMIARAIREVFDDGSVTSLFEGNA